MTVVWGGAINREVEHVTLSVNGESYTVQRVVRDDSALLPPRDSHGCAIADHDAPIDPGDRHSPLTATQQHKKAIKRARDGMRYRSYTDEQKQAVLASVAAGMTKREAARLHSMNESSVRSLVFLAGAVKPCR